MTSTRPLTREPNPALYVYCPVAKQWQKSNGPDVADCAFDIACSAVAAHRTSWLSNGYRAVSLVPAQFAQETCEAEWVAWRLRGGRAPKGRDAERSRNEYDPRHI